jgi:hypothetical protein
MGFVPDAFVTDDLRSYGAGEPDFGPDDFAAAIADFHGCERRFGGLGQIAALEAAE